MDDTEKGHLNLSFQNKYWSSIDDCQRAMFLNRPSIMLRLVPIRDGDKWSVLYGSNIQEGVCGFGDTPDEACKEFDKAWISK